jgi:hypothetical protein
MTYLRKLALGIQDDLDAFARDNSAETWTRFAISDPMQWMIFFLDLMNDSDVEVLFNLKGVNVWEGVTRAAAGRGGATDWELLQIMQNPGWWSRIRWIEDGIPKPNPFE